MVVVGKLFDDGSVSAGFLLAFLLFFSMMNTFLLYCLLWMKYAKGTYCDRVKWDEIGCSSLLLFCGLKGCRFYCLVLTGLLYYFGFLYWMK